MELVVTATLVCEGNLSIGAGEPDHRTDRPVLRDQRGDPYIPGTSLAGALRAATERRYGIVRATELFGTTEGERAVPSAVTVHDAPLHWDTAWQRETVPTEIRPHVAMDRCRLAARPRLLFNEEVWPRGLAFDVRLTCPASHVDDLLGAMEELASPRGGIGAGPCPVAFRPAPAVSSADIDLQASLRAAVARYGSPDPLASPWTAGTAVDGFRPTPPRSHADGLEWIRFDLTLRCEDPLLSRIPLDPAGGGGDNLPFTVTRLGPQGELQQAVALAGSGLKGVLRQRAERYCALAGRAAEDPWDIGRPPASDHPVARLFGWASGGRDARGAAGLLRVDDLVACAWEPIGVDPSELEAVESYDRVHLDRLTGQTHTTHKFTDTAVRSGTEMSGWIAIVPPPGGRIEDLDVALLAFGLRDLAAGDVGLGGSTHSGYGTVILRSCTMRVARPGAADGRVDELSLVPEGDASPDRPSLEWPEEWRRRIGAAWTAFANEPSGERC